MNAFLNIQWCEKTYFYMITCYLRFKILSKQRMWISYKRNRGKKIRTYSNSLQGNKIHKIDDFSNKVILHLKLEVTRLNIPVFVFSLLRYFFDH
jgi:hypothetical protein